MPKSAAPSITGHVAAIRKLSSIQAPSVLFENLYFVIRDLMGKFWTSRKYRNVSESSKEMIREAGTRLIVCGQGFDKGQITRLLNSTRLICESVLEILLDLGRLLTGIPRRVSFPGSDIFEMELSALRGCIDQWDADRDMNQSESLDGPKESVTRTSRASPFFITELGKDVMTVPNIHSFNTGRERLFDFIETCSESDIYENMQNHTECLMDLLPALVHIEEQLEPVPREVPQAELQDLQRRSSQTRTLSSPTQAPKKLTPIEHQDHPLTDTPKPERLKPLIDLFPELSVPNEHFFPSTEATTLADISQQEDHTPKASRGPPWRLYESSHSRPFPEDYSSPAGSGRISTAWSEEDDNLLVQYRAQGYNWGPIATHFPKKTPNACRKRHERLMEKKNRGNQEGIKFEALAEAYLECREKIWKVFADCVGEKWTAVETKCMEKGLKTLQTAGLTARRRDELNDTGSPHLFSDSGVGASETEFNDSDLGLSNEKRNTFAQPRWMSPTIQGWQASTEPSLQHSGPQTQLQSPGLSSYMNFLPKPTAMLSSTLPLSSTFLPFASQTELSYQNLSAPRNQADEPIRYPSP